MSVRNHFSALSSLVCRCQSLEYLALGMGCSLTDESIRDLSPYLHNLVAVKLEDCCHLTISTFYILAKSCPLLQDIEMVGADLGEETCSIMGDCMNKYMNIKSLNLSHNIGLNDECLRRFAFICPNLEKIDVSSCTSITEFGIADVFDMCPQLRSSKFDYYFVSEEELERLPEEEEYLRHYRGLATIGKRCPGLGLNVEELDIGWSLVDDRELATMGERCLGLLKLGMTCCPTVTTRGVEEVLRQCKSLIEIHLKGCPLVNLNNLDWTVLSRSSSLKKVLASSEDSSIIEEKRKSLFLRYGFRVYLY